jgi:thiol:disulfide interchange protein
MMHLDEFAAITAVSLMKTLRTSCAYSTVRAGIRAMSCSALILLASIAQAEFTPAPPPAGVAGLPDYALQFDPRRDPELDLLAARAAAAQAKRPVLLVVGGDWCVWCFLLDRHFSRDADAARAWYGAFEVVRVYYGDDNKNARFLARYPDFELFPHFFIVAPDGKLRGASTADVLIRDAKYDNALLRAFIDRWSAGK